MAHFFATAEDLLPVLESIESSRSVAYTLTGQMEKHVVESFYTCRDLRTLFESASSDSATTSSSYLVTERDRVVSVRAVPSPTGKQRWAIDQLQNPDSAVLWHGGFCGPRTLLHGRVATASRSPVAVSLQRAFDTTIRKHFVRIKAFYVGKQAEQLLDSGHRLTASAQSPLAYDLCR